MREKVYILIGAAAVMFFVIGGLSLLAHYYTLNGIKKYLECGRGQMSVKNFFHKLGKISLLRSMHIYQNRDRKVVNLKH